MEPETWALAVSTVSAGIGLTTLALVIRNELRERRKNEPIIWAFHRYGTGTWGEDEEVLEVAELVQFGRQPTRVSHYHPVGFKVHVKDGHRLRAHVKAEDTLPLLLREVNADDAWMLISHFPRDDRRWLIFEWVALEPSSDVFRDRVAAAWDRIAVTEGSFKQKARRSVLRLLPRRSVIRPVGPDGYQWARVRADRGSRKNLEADIATITSLAGETGLRAI